MSGPYSYPLNGADRFQLFFDSAARKRTGIGNVIRVVITIEGLISTEELMAELEKNSIVKILIQLKLRRHWYSTLFRFESDESQADLASCVTFHAGDASHAMQVALSRDFPPSAGKLFHIDAICRQGQTDIIISTSHILMDYKGMENLIASLAGEKLKTFRSGTGSGEKSFNKKLAGAIRATRYVAGLSGWNMRRLKRRTGKGIAELELLELSEEETTAVNSKMDQEVRTNALSFFLGCSLDALKQHEELLNRSTGNFFVAVPVERRPAKNNHDVLSNYLSFLYFHAKENEITNVKEISGMVFYQMIRQAKEKLPEKFSALLHLFRFIPAKVYSAFINLPGNGHAGTFAFSMLGNSCLENKPFMGRKVLNVTHYAPVISPPGLNIVFTAFRNKLKIILSFDEGRITREDAAALLQTIRKNLLG